MSFLCVVIGLMNIIKRLVSCWWCLAYIICYLFSWCHCASLSLFFFMYITVAKKLDTNKWHQWFCHFSNFQKMSHSDCFFFQSFVWWRVSPWFVRIVRSFPCVSIGQNVSSQRMKYEYLWDCDRKKRRRIVSYTTCIQRIFLFVLRCGGSISGTDEEQTVEVTGSVFVATARLLFTHLVIIVDYWPWPNRFPCYLL